MTYFQSKYALKSFGNTLVKYNASKKTKNPDAMTRILQIIIFIAFTALFQHLTVPFDFSSYPGCLYH